MRAVTFDPAHRSVGLERLSTTAVDVLVVGGGVTGAGIALDAVARELSTALVEQRDPSSGTSSRSSKLLHGGLRCLLDDVLTRRARSSLETFEHRGVTAERAWQPQTDDLGADAARLGAPDVRAALGA